MAQRIMTALYADDFPLASVLAFMAGAGAAHADDAPLGYLNDPDVHALGVLASEMGLARNPMIQVTGVWGLWQPDSRDEDGNGALSRPLPMWARVITARLHQLAPRPIRDDLPIEVSWGMLRQALDEATPSMLAGEPVDV